MSRIAVEVAATVLPVDPSDRSGYQMHPQIFVPKKLMSFDSTVALSPPMTTHYILSFFFCLEVVL